MNARMRILVQVLGRDAVNQLRQVGMAVAGVATASNRGGDYGILGRKGPLGPRGGIRRHISDMVNFGKNTQWVGRQLEFRFTLPLIAAGYAATKFALDNERALTRVRKVYGDLDMPQKRVRREVNQLSHAFRALSDIFGFHQSEVIQIAAGWAQAGASGIALAKATRFTLETMVLGEMEAKEAAEGLITVMTQYGLTTKDLRLNLAYLNAVENQTAIGFADLIEVVQKSGGVAREAGIDIRHLAAMAAALVPAAGSASEVGTMLKSSIFRIMAPTNQATEAMQRLGVVLGQDILLPTRNASERFELIAEALDKLTQPERLRAVRDIFELRQGSRAAVAARDMVNFFSQYRRALHATADDAKVLELYSRELGIVLRSQPQAFKILTTQIQNSVAEVGVTLLPAILGVMSRIRDMADAFSKLNPYLQQWILLLTLGLAIFGPLLSYVGAFIALLGQIGKILLGGLLGGLRLMGLLLTSPWALAIAAIAAVIALIVVFRDEVASAVKSVWEWFVGLAEGISKTFGAAMAALPRSVVAAFRAVANIIRDAALEIYEWLSYINPFARHSPSLVESVARGIDFIARKYASLRGVSAVFRDQVRDLISFRQAMQGVDQDRRAWTMTENRTAVATANPGALGQFDALYRSTEALYPQLSKIENEFRSQEAIVAALAYQLRLAEESYSGIDDAIFAATQEQTRLRLEMMTLEDAVGSIEDIRDQLSALQGEIELLRGERADLLFGGAGSDVLGPIDDQIAALEAARRALRGNAVQLDNYEQSISELQRSVERMEMEKELGLAPLNYELERQQQVLGDLADAWDGIAAQIREAESAMADYATLGTGGAAGGAGAGAGGVGGAGGDFGVPGGVGGLFQREAGSIEDLADRWAKEAKKSFGNLKLFKPLKDAWLAVKNFLGNDVPKFFSDLFGGMDVDFSRLGESLGNLWKSIESSGAWRLIEHLVGELVYTFEVVFDAIADAAKVLWPILKDLATALWDALVPVVVELYKTIGPVVELIVTVLTVAWHIILAVSKFVWNAILAVVEWVWDKIGKIVMDVIDFIGSIIAAGLKFIRGVVEVILGIIHLDFGRIWNGIKTIVSSVWNAIKSIVSLAINAVWHVIEAVLKIIAEVWGLAWGGIKLAAEVVWEGLKFGLNTLLTVFTTVWNGIVWVVQNAWNILSGIFTTIWNVITGTLSTVWNGFESATRTAWNGVKSVIGSVLRAIGGAIGWFLDAVGDVADVVNLGGDFHRWAKSARSWGVGLAQGGQVPANSGPWVTNGVAAIVGEGSPSHPEYVIPTDPKYRDRALMFINEALGVMGFARGGRVPMFAAGGRLSKSEYLNRVGLLSTNPGTKIYRDEDVRFFNGDWSGGAAWKGVVEAFRTAKPYMVPVRQARKTFDDMYVSASEVDTYSFNNATWYGRGDGWEKILRSLAANGAEALARAAGWPWDADRRAMGIPGLPAKTANKEVAEVIRWVRGKANARLQEYDSGGWLHPGWTLAYNGTGRDERVLGPRDSNGRQINFYGDLVFPNVEDGDDAEEFIRNLEALV